MDPTLGTSFIPKQTLGSASDRARKRKGSPFGFITIIALVLLLIAITVGVGEFLYKQILENTIESKSETLTRARGAFEPALIEELVRLDARITNAQTLLNEHIAPSLFFEALEALTLKSVRFRDLTYTRVGEDKISLGMSGTARNFAGVALQADVFGEDRLIREPIFSNLNLDQSGNVIFDLTAVVDPSFIRFANTLSRMDESVTPTQ